MAMKRQNKHRLKLNIHHKIILSLALLFLLFHYSTLFEFHHKIEQ